MQIELWRDSDGAHDGVIVNIPFKFALLARGDVIHPWARLYIYPMMSPQKFIYKTHTTYLCQRMNVSVKSTSMLLSLQYQICQN
jgi:hypothetical protein